MNRHELRGGARNLGGRLESAVGDAMDSRDWKAAGARDQLSGAAQRLVGRARSTADDVARTAPDLIDEARERIEAASERAVAATRRGSDTAARTIRANDERLLLAALAAAGGYLAGWLIHRRA